MRRIHRAGGMLRAGIVILSMSALGCTSSTELEGISTQLADIQLQVLQLQKQGPSKAEVAELKSEAPNND